MSLPLELGLRETQAAFAAALRLPRGHDEPSQLLAAGIGGPAEIDAAARLEVYRTNTRYFFRTALERTYPVVRHRVGDEHFRQLAHDYRTAHPSSHGDLHWVGERFPEWLASRTRDTPYAWLADLARLEWACEAAWAAAGGTPLALDVLGRIAPDRLDQVALSLHPSVRLVASQHAIWSVWQANQGNEPGAPVDLTAGPEYCVVACVDAQVAVYRVAPADYSLLELLALASSLGTAIATSGYDIAGLTVLLAWLFDERLVTGLRLTEP